MPTVAACVNIAAVVPPALGQAMLQPCGFLRLLQVIYLQSWTASPACVATALFFQNDGQNESSGMQNAAGPLLQAADQ